jgi:hypothetical protein
MKILLGLLSPSDWTVVLYVKIGSGHSFRLPSIHDVTLIFGDDMFTIEHIL